ERGAVEAQAAERVRDRGTARRRRALLHLGRVRRVDGRHAGRIALRVERREPAREDLRTAARGLRRPLGTERRGAGEERERLLEAARAGRDLRRLAQDDRAE